MSTDVGYQPVEVPFLKSASSPRALAFILLLSGGVLAFLFWLIYFKPASGYSPGMIGALPAVNASLNALSAALLTAGFVAIRRFLTWFQPAYQLHGHVHLYDRSQPFQTRFAATEVINVYPFQRLELRFAALARKQGAGGRGQRAGASEQEPGVGG